MVKSNLDDSINYQENNIIDQKDIDYESYIYNGNIYNKPINFVLGEPNFEHTDNNVVFFNVYLVNNDEVIMKIGILEIQNTQYRNSFIADTEDIDIGKFFNEQNPILFSEAKEYIRTTYNLNIDLPQVDSDGDDSVGDDSVGDDSSEADSSEADTTSELKDIDKMLTTDDEDENADKTGDETGDETIVIIEETKEASEAERKAYKSNEPGKEKDVWINDFMRSHKYKIRDTATNGDCFFHAIQIALNETSEYKDLTVDKIRKRLSLEGVTEDVFKTYKERYDAFLQGSRESEKEISDRSNSHKAYKKKISLSSDKEERNKLISAAYENVKKLSDSKNSFSSNKSNLGDVGFMNSVNNLEDMKQAVLKSTYYADEWSIPCIERLYKIKTIILEQDLYVGDSDDNSVLQCGHIDPILEKLFQKFQNKEYGGQPFEPEYYIILNHTIEGVHYKLITYDKNIDKGSFKFKELPYRIKELVLENCLKKCAGPFSIIPDFRNLATSCNIELEEQKTTKEQLLSGVNIPKKSANKDILYDDSITFKIRCDGKANKVKIGTSGDKISATDKTKFANLEAKKDWRTILDDAYKLTNFFIDGVKYDSAQDYYFKTLLSYLNELFGDKDKKELKEISDLSKKLDCKEMVKLYYNIEKSPKEYPLIKSVISKNKEQFELKKSAILKKALIAKFNHDASFKEILKNTKEAKIEIFVPYLKSDLVATELMEVRSELLTDKK
jgi:predicted NAD-dependent protein-ADP-ribosyltransferase YbiA (DUF1768 family)